MRIECLDTCHQGRSSATRASRRACAFNAAIALAVLAIASGCGTSSSAGEGGPDASDVVPIGDTGASDAEDTDSSTTEVGVIDTTPPMDIDEVDEDAEPEPHVAEVGETCLEDGDCVTEFCITFGTPAVTGVCSDRCARDADCPSGFECALDTTSGADRNRFCLPTTFCFDQDDDGYGIGPGCIGPDCDDLDPTINPGAVEQCDGKDNNCNGVIDDNPEGVNQDCSTVFEGVCAEGRTACVNGLLTCVSRRSATEEVCNGLDDNCNGVIDEAPNGEPLSRPCYDGPAGTLDVGQCVAGNQWCVDAGWSGCSGQVLPSAEVCDGLDNNCNGAIDDGVSAGMRCATGLVGVCAEGTSACIDGGEVCQPITPPRDEVCNGLDDDCDGRVDEGAAGGPLERACYNGPADTRGVGACRDGYERCEDGSFTSCVDQVLPLGEVCNGVDDNCNGVIDENVPEGQFCPTGLPGICAAGYVACNDGSNACLPVQPPRAEICNGLDDNCNGNVDEGPDGGPLERACYPGPPATRGVGVCQDGAEVCDAGGYTSCSGAVTPSPEVCNGLDDNCNGIVDEGVGGGACDTGLQGICAQGAIACTGAPVCNQTVEPRAELCNGLDDNCNGTIDEGVAPQPCWPEGVAGRGVGRCADGERVCEGGAFSDCRGAVLPRAELCNGLDDNCNGAVDEGNPGGGVVCSTGLQGICASGTTACTGGVLACNPSQSPSAEVCNGLDDNCNGVIDERPGGGGPLVRSCYGGAPGTVDVGVCRAGTETCSGGSYGTCSGQITPSPEVCNGVDDNCNGNVDEGNPGAGVNCNTGQPGICAAGQTQCSGGSISCQRLNNPTTEICNGIDDNCNGVIDERPGGGGPLTRTCYTGPSGTQGVGICRAGTETCSSGTFGTCSGQVTPTTESCNGADNNCNGTVDEGCPIGISLTNAFWSTNYGGGGGTAFTRPCAAGSAMTGFNIRHGSRIDFFQAVCSPISIQENRSVNPFTYLVNFGAGTVLASSGGGGGTYAAFRCPANEVLYRIDLRSGSAVDQLRGYCARPTVTGTSGNFTVGRSIGGTSATYGGSGGTLVNMICPNAGVITGVQGRAGSRIDAIGFRCSTPTVTLR